MFTASIRTTYVPEDERRALCSQPTTLNGLPANVCGVHNMFATVRTLNGRLSVDYTWHAVRHLLENGEGFKA